jgi:hypothetical protein
MDLPSQKVGISDTQSSQSLTKAHCLRNLANLQLAKECQGIEQLADVDKKVLQELINQAYN